VQNVLEVELKVNARVAADTGPRYGRIRILLPVDESRLCCPVAQFRTERKMWRDCSFCCDGGEYFLIIVTPAILCSLTCGCGVVVFCTACGGVESIPTSTQRTQGRCKMEQKK
jgi:hypothetical protein